MLEKLTSIFREKPAQSSEVLKADEQRVLAVFAHSREASVAEVFAAPLQEGRLGVDSFLPSEVERITGLLQERGFISQSDQKPIVEDCPYFELTEKGKDVNKQIGKNSARFREQITVKI